MALVNAVVKHSISNIKLINENMAGILKDLKSSFISGVYLPPAWRITVAIPRLMDNITAPKHCRLNLIANPALLKLFGIPGVKGYSTTYVFLCSAIACIVILSALQGNSFVERQTGLSTIHLHTQIDHFASEADELHTVYISTGHICICMCVCVCVCMNVCMYVRIYVYKYIERKGERGYMQLICHQIVSKLTDV